MPTSRNQPSRTSLISPTERLDRQPGVSLRRRIVVRSAFGGSSGILQALELAGTNRIGGVDEIHALVGGRQRRAVERALLDQPRRHGALARRCRELGVPRDSVIFNRRTIHVAIDECGRKVMALRTDADVSALANLAFAVISDAARGDDDITVLISQVKPDLAAHLLFGALQVLGRGGDRPFLMPTGIEIPVVLARSNPQTPATLTRRAVGVRNSRAPQHHRP